MEPHAKLRTSDRWVLGLAIAAGVALLLIGIRFLVVPHQAARFFGLANPPGPFDLHHIVALRDIWLALMLIGLALLREWRALALCLGLGAAVCLGDAAIVLASSARPSAVAFHLASGVYCGALAWSAWSASRRPS
jgi:hypothetical protein